MTETVTNTNGTGSDEGTGTGGPGGTEQYIQYIPPSSTNPAPTFDSGPIVVHVATQNTGVRLAPQDPGVALPSTGAPYALAPDVSADGHRVVFVTSATLPSSGGGLSNGNVWLYDQTTGTLTNISALELTITPAHTARLTAHRSASTAISSSSKAMRPAVNPTFTFTTASPTP